MVWNGKLLVAWFSQPWMWTERTKMKVSPFTSKNWDYINIWSVKNLEDALSNFKRNEKHVFWWFSTGRYIWHFLWVRYGGYSGYGTVGTVGYGTVGTVGTVRWVRYGGYGGYCTVGTVGAYLHAPYRTHHTHRTVPTVPNVPHPSPYHHFWGPYSPTEHYSWNLIKDALSPWHWHILWRA